MLSIGVDIEEVSRFKRLLDSKPQILQKIFTQYEWKYAQTKHQAQTLAGLWCAKEAVVKALVNYVALDIRDVHINHYSNGAPFVCTILNFEIAESYDISLSVSHTKNYATATCVIQKVA